MAVKAEVITELNLFLTRASGSLSDQDLVAYQESIASMPGFSSELNTLLDGREVTENLLSQESLIRYSTKTPFASSVRRAYVVRDEKAAMYATLFGATSSDSDKYFVTYSIDDACEWLGIEFNSIKNSIVYQDE